MDPLEGERDVDKWLDAAINRYSQDDPRNGLETRVLASLRAERERVASRRWRWLAAGLGIAATAAMAVFVGLGHTKRTDVSSSGGNAAIRHDENANRRTIPPAPHLPSQAAGKASSHPPIRRAAPEPRGAAKLDRFPAPSPLSDQEKLLARYVQQFPQRAALSARAQTEIQKLNQLEMAAPWPKKANAADTERPE